MGRHLHFDCFNGISGDMTLGALVDLGLEVSDLEKGLARLPIGEFHLKAERVKRSGIVGTRLHVEVEEDPGSALHLSHVREKIEQAGLGERVTSRALEAYGLLARAEAHVHGSTPEKIHFHEVGSNDAIVDIAGAMLGVELLGIESFSSSAVALGNGTVKCSHGVMPIPAPATAELLKGLPTRTTDIEGELTTPTGAAILRTLAGERVGEPVGMKTEAIGYGAGARRLEHHPNYLRLSLGERVTAGEGTALAALPVDHEEIISLETEIDDMSPEVSGHLMERLFAAGARDVHFSAVQMKKNRPGHHVRTLCLRSDSGRLAEIIFRETSTFGLRVVAADRLCLKRRSESVETTLGPVEVKVGLWGDRVLKVSPEYESCRSIAAVTGRPLREVYEVAGRAIQERYFSDRAGGGEASLAKSAS